MPRVLVRIELLLDVADAFFVFSSAQALVCLLIAGSLFVSLARRQPMPQLAAWTLLTAVLSVLACAQGYCHRLS